MLSAQLEAAINDELRWREAELALAKVGLQRSLNDRATFRFTYRCFVAMTYAHFEAYTKRIIAQAVQDILNSGNRWSAFVPSIKAHLFSAQLRQEIQKLSNLELAEVGSLGVCLIDRVAAPSLDDIIECGNLNVTNFVWILECAGLDASKFAFARRDVGRLTSLRHDCAHGEALTLDPTKTHAQLASEMYTLQASILLVMHTVAVELIDHFTNSNYILR